MDDRHCQHRLTGRPARGALAESERLGRVVDAPDGLQPLVDRTIEAALRRSNELAAEAARD